MKNHQTLEVEVVEEEAQIQEEETLQEGIHQEIEEDNFFFLLYSFKCNFRLDLNE